MNETLEAFKRVWLKQPDAQTNNQFILHLCSIVQQCKDTDVSAVETRKVIVKVDAICEEFSKWQVVVFKNYGVPEDAEILAESAFRQFIPSFMAGKSMLELWEHLAFEHWSKINRFKKVTFANWQKKIATTQMRWREHLDSHQPHREFGV